MEEPPSCHSVQVFNHSNLTCDVKSVTRAVHVCLQYLHAPPADVRVLITHDEEVAKLNERFRGLSGPTDVLTFADENEFSGDIAIAAPYALRQSALREISFDHEVLLLAIHGTLHLAGMEDKREDDRVAMIREMYAVAGQLGLDQGEDWGSLLHQEELV